MLRGGILWYMLKKFNIIKKWMIPKNLLQKWRNNNKEERAKTKTKTKRKARLWHIKYSNQADEQME